MILLIVFLMCMFVALAIGVMAGISDVRTMTIPNEFSLFMIGAFLLCYAALYVGGYEEVFGGLLNHALAAVGTFVVTFILFGLKVIGAGDSKFATACALWISVWQLPIFLFFMTVGGAFLSMFAIYMKRKKPFQNPREGSWAAVVQGGTDKVPYAVAISFGMLIAFVYSGYFSADTLTSFLS